MNKENSVDSLKKPQCFLVYEAEGDITEANQLIDLMVKAGVYGGAHPIGDDLGRYIYPYLMVGSRFIEGSEEIKEFLKSYG